MFTRSRIRNRLFSLGIVALFLAFLPEFNWMGGDTNGKTAEHLRANPGDMPILQEFRLGWPGSPLLLYRDERKLIPKADGGFQLVRTSGTAINLISWSGLTLVVSIVLLGLAYSIKPDDVDSAAGTTAETQKGT